MRLLFVLTELPYPPHRNGVALINYHILTRAPVGVTIDLNIAAYPDEAAESTLRKKAPAICNIEYLGCACGRRYRIGNLLSGALLGYNIFTLTKWQPAVGCQYDAIYASPLMTYFDLRKLQPLFLNAVDSFARLNDNSYLNSGRIIDLIKSLLYRRYESRVLRHVALTNFVSRADMDYVLSQYPGLSLISLPNGVDSEYFCPDFAEREVDSLLFTGNFSYVPNAEAALYLANNIFPTIQATRPNARLYIVGRTPPATLLNRPGIVVTGYVDDIREYYRKCQIFVCPLLSGAGIKNKVLEAMATGIPIVATSLSVDGIDAMMPEQHYLQADKLDIFSAQINRLLNSNELQLRLLTEARALIVDRMGWGQVANRYYMALTSLTKAHL